MPFLAAAAGAFFSSVAAAAAEAVSVFLAEGLGRKGAFLTEVFPVEVFVAEVVFFAAAAVFLRASSQYRLKLSSDITPFTVMTNKNQKVENQLHQV